MSGLRERMQRNERLVGTVLAVPDLALAEVAGAEFDFAWLDLEHSTLSVADVQTLAIATRAGGCDSLVRLPRADPDLLPAVLDTGVAGIVAPHVESAAEAFGLVERLHHPPDGRRGFAHRRWNDWGREPGQVPVCIVQIESAAGVAAAAEIAQVAGVDALVVGMADLALDLDRPPGTVDAEVLRAAVVVREAARRATVAAGFAGAVPEQLGSLDDDGGAALYVVAADVGLYAAALRGAATSARRVLDVAIAPNGGES